MSNEFILLFFIILLFHYFIISLFHYSIIPLFVYFIYFLADNACCNSKGTLRYILPFIYLLVVVLILFLENPPVLQDLYQRLVYKRREKERNTTKENNLERMLRGVV